MAADAADQIAKRLIKGAWRYGSTTFNLRNIALTEVPETIGRLSQLENLDLSGNQIGCISLL
ncbi:MAG: hypothetical protein EBE86_024215 [Hormoscilla sp. GUM202]|nr:hypothetical protein [Hormoscilla sp. GUM202]